MKHILYAFLLALAGYILFYAAIEYRRTRNGPWQASFTRSAGGEPTLLVNQPKLGITNVQVTFAGTGFSADANGPTLFFRQPRSVPYDVPFGKCVFMDTTFLPGAVTFELFGHEIELLPRVLIIDHKEHQWEPHSRIAVPWADTTPQPGMALTNQSR